MDLHRLRVVEFDTSVREKEREKNHIAEFEKCKREERKTSSARNKDGIGYENQSLNENGNPHVPSKKSLGEEISPAGTSIKCLGDTSSPPGAIKNCENDVRTPPRIPKQCSDDKLGLLGTKKYMNDTAFTSHLGTSNNQRSQSEILKIPPKKKPRKRGLKINSSDLGLTKFVQDSAYSHHKKRTLNVRNRSRNARIHHKEENIKEKKEKSDEVHFLFAREKPSFIRYRRKRTDTGRTKINRDSKLPNDICGFQTSNRSLAQYQYQMSHFNFIDTDKLPFKKLGVGFHRKPKPPHPVTNCFCKHHAMRVLNSACGNGDSRPIHYNLGNHPQPRRYQQKQISDQQKELRNERSHCMAKDEIVEVSPSSFSPVCKSFHDARTGPSKVQLTSGSHNRPLSLLENSTTLQNCTIASEYKQKSCQLPNTPSPYAASADPTDRQDCELKKSQTYQDVTNVGNQKSCLPPSAPSPCTLCAARAPAQSNCKKKHKKTKRPSLVLTSCNGFLSKLVKLVTDFHVKNNMSGKSCIKYVIFGLIIVVWSPCLLAVILAWVVMFPWKLTNILKTDVTANRSFPINYSFKRFRKNNLRREYQQMCFENYLPEKKRSFMTSAASWYSRTVGVVVNSFNAVISLLKLKKKTPTRAGSSFLPPSHPNPRKRYKLFYAQNRGWVMKPLRRRTRSCASNRAWQSMRCEFKPKFWQKIRCQNLQQTSLNKVPCPVHGADNYPMNQSSPAGDACLVQGRNPWPSCTCWDKFSQRPRAFKPPNSHYRRQQQVNIPPTFYYTTSGIASISKDETGNTKSNVFNSIKITNNISHNNFAKDHLGQRTNGTLPFGVVSKGNKHDVGNTLIKASGVHSITSLTDITNHIPCRGLNRLERQTTKREIPLNYISARSHKLSIANKNTPTLQKKNFSNKYVLTDIFQSALTKQINTSTHTQKTQTQNNPNHIPYQKITNKPKMAKDKAEMASKYAREVKLLQPKQGYKYKSDKSRAPAQKHPVKIKSNIKQDTVVNYSFGNKRKQSKRSYKYKPNLVPVTTQMLSNTVDITTMTNRTVALNGPCGKKYAYKAQPVSVAIQKHLCTADITTSTNRNVGLNCHFEEDCDISKYGDQGKPSNPTLPLHQIPVATQMQSRTADNATSTKHNVSLNFPSKEKHELSQQNYKHKLRKLTVETAENVTDTNQKVALNYLSRVKPSTANKEKSETVNKYIPGHIIAATQKQSNTADITTMINCDKALNYPYGKNHEKSEQAIKCKLSHNPVGAQMPRKTVDMSTSTKNLGGITQITPKKRIPHGCIPGTSKKDTICTEKRNLPEYLFKTQDISIEKQSKQSLAPQTLQDSNLQSNNQQLIMTSNCVCSVTHSLTQSQNKPDKKTKQIAAYNINIHKTSSAKEPPNKQSTLPQASSLTVQEESKLFGIASDCTCGKNVAKKSSDKNILIEQSTVPKESRQYGSQKTPVVDAQGLKRSPVTAHPRNTGITTESQPTSTYIQELPCDCKCNSVPPLNSKFLQYLPRAQPELSKKDKTLSKFPRSTNILSNKTDSGKEPSTKQPNLIQSKSRTSHEQSTFGIGSDCTCGTNQITTGEKNLYHNVTGSKSTRAKETKSKSVSTCPCPVVGLQYSVRKQSTGTKANKTLSKKNCVKVDKTRSKLPKSSKHTQPQEYLHHDCCSRCPVKNLQDPINKKTSQSSRNSGFSRKSKHKSFDFPDECPCSFSQNDLNKTSFKSDVPVSLNTTIRLFIRSHERESTCSVNELSSGVQSSKISQYSSKVSSLVMSLHSKLFSSKSKQTEVHENPTKEPLPVKFSSLLVEPKKANKRATTINYILESLLDNESNQSLFRRSHKSKTSQKPSLTLHSSHSNCSCPIHKSSSRQCSSKSKYIRKPLIVDKLDSCLHSVAKTFQRPSFFAHSTKYDCRSQSIIIDHRVSQSIISQQSKTSELSSIVSLFTRKPHSKSKFDPQYFPTLINCQETPTVRQTVRSQLPPSPKTLKSKNSSSFNCPQPKVFFEKIRSITDKISTNTLKHKQDKNVSTPGVQTALIYASKCACSPEKLLHLSKKISHPSAERATIRQSQVSEQSFQLRSTQPNISKMDYFHRSNPPKMLTLKKQFEVIPQQLNAEPVIPIITGTNRCVQDQKVKKDHSSNKKQLPPQPPKAELVIPIISERCTCAGKQNNTIENSSNNKLPNTNSPPLGNEKKLGFLQHLSNQTPKSPASQSHSNHQTGTPLNKPYKCRFKHSNEQGESNGLHKIVKNRRSPEKFRKSHLISHVLTCSATERRIKEHNIIQRSEISQSPQIQPSPQIQIYEQNLPNQQRLSKLPTNVDKPPAEMLQRHHPGHGRKSTAEGEVQQPYPDFNRVSMRYPGHKSPPKSSLQIPGINGPSLANNYPPAPGATLSPNYDPCFTNLPKRYIPKSPYDETALRRAYKRRPLRYTPPRQQLPRVIMVKKLKENKQRAAEAKRRRGIQRTESFLKCLRHLINKTEREVWPTDVKCHPMWLNALKRKPCFESKAFPRAYPTFLNCYKTHKYIGQLLVYFITLCFWSPILLCGYLCCNVLCKCCS